MVDAFAGAGWSHAGCCLHNTPCDPHFYVSTIAQLTISSCVGFM